MSIRKENAIYDYTLIFGKEKHIFYYKRFVTTNGIKNYGR